MLLAVEVAWGGLAQSAHASWCIHSTSRLRLRWNVCSLHMTPVVAQVGLTIRDSVQFMALTLRTHCCMTQGHSKTHSRYPCTVVPNVSQHVPCLHVGISPETDEQADFVREFQRALDDGTITRMAPTPSV